jgi:tetratricopeptide (TPR) repeat protein
MEADKLLSQSLKMREALYGAEHPKVAASYRHAAILHAVQKDHAEAARLMSRSLQIEKSLSVGGPNGRWALALLDGAGLLARIGQIDDAKGFYESALPVLERELGLGAPRLQDARKRYADLGPK